MQNVKLFIQITNWAAVNQTWRGHKYLWHPKIIIHFFLFQSSTRSEMPIAGKAQELESDSSALQPNHMMLLIETGYWPDEASLNAHGLLNRMLQNSPKNQCKYILGLCTSALPPATTDSKAADGFPFSPLFKGSWTHHKMRSPIRLGHLQRRKPLSWQATALIHRSAHSSLHRSVNPRAHRQRWRVLHCSQWQPATGCYFTFWRRLCVRVLRGLPAAMTLEHKDACGCVVDRSLFEFPEWAAAWRWAVAHHRGRRCLPRLRFRSWSEQPSFFVFCHHPYTRIWSRVETPQRRKRQ